MPSVVCVLPAVDEGPDSASSVSSLVDTSETTCKARLLTKVLILEVQSSGFADFWLFLVHPWSPAKGGAAA